MVQRSKHPEGVAFDPTPHGFFSKSRVDLSVHRTVVRRFSRREFRFRRSSLRTSSDAENNGAALAKVHGEFLVCVASKLANAPMERIATEGGGLTGMCFSSGKIQLSNDTNTDRRIDMAACSELGVRSVLAIHS